MEQRLSVTQDLTNLRFGLLTVRAFAGYKTTGQQRSASWMCRCDCGEETVALAAHIKAGAVESCGCLQRERSVAASTTHGMRKSPEYESWHSMWQRCTNPNKSGFKDYGGRGITVCDTWRSFERFYADMGPRPYGYGSGYSPDNCMWATPSEQSRNKRMRLDNTSGVVGVFFEARRGKWRAKLNRNGVNLLDKAFATKEEAIAARMAALQECNDGMGAR